MTLKEKLELLWKYLLLAVIFYGLTQLGRPHHSGMMKCDHHGKSDKTMMWYSGDHHGSGDMEVDVEIEKLLDGDSTITVIVNGEKIDISDLDKIDEKIFVKKMKHEGKGKEHKVKIIKKKISD